ncbi:MAG TPA: hypothetical protein VN037_02090 [Verrucomicrobiae bacterium]|nr:hypothetical protein [Verrucomicrobiae bacterium]
MSIYRKSDALQFLHASLDQRLIAMSKNNSYRRPSGVVNIQRPGCDPFGVL